MTTKSKTIPIVSDEPSEEEEADFSADESEGSVNEDEGSASSLSGSEEDSEEGSENAPVEEDDSGEEEALDLSEPEEPEEEPVKEPTKKTSIHVSKPASRAKSSKKKTPPKETKSRGRELSSRSRSSSRSPSPVQTRPPPTQKGSTTRKSSVPRTRKPGTKTFVARKELTYLNKVKKAALGLPHGYTIGELRSVDTSKNFSRKLSHKDLAKGMYELELQTVLERAEGETGEAQRESYGNVLSTLGVKGVKTNNVAELKRLIKAKMDDYNVVNHTKDTFDPSRPCSANDKTNKDPFAYSNAVLKSLAKIRGIQASKLDRQQLCDALKASAPSSKAKTSSKAQKASKKPSPTKTKTLPTKNPKRSVFDLIGQHPEVSTFEKLLVGNPEALSYLSNDVVVLAPDNESFSSLPDGLLDYLVKEGVLEDILLQHIIPDVKTINTEDGDPRAANGSPVDVEIFTGSSDIEILKGPITASNGTLYVIRGILQSAKTSEYVSAFLESNRSKSSSKSKSPSPQKGKTRKTKVSSPISEILEAASAPQKKSPSKAASKKATSKKSPPKAASKKSSPTKKSATKAKSASKATKSYKSVFALVKGVATASNFAKLLEADGRNVTDHVTVVAPSDDAFDALDASYKAKIFDDDTARAAFIENHLVPSVVTPGDFDVEEEGGTGSIQTTWGNEYPLSYENGTYFVNNYPVVFAQHAKNGYVYVIDGVLDPEQEGNNTVSEILNEIQEQENVNTFLEALDASGLSLFVPNVPVVVFVPSDEAFNELPAGVLDDLLADKDKLATVLKNHIIYAEDANKAKATSLGGSTIALKKVAGQLTPDDANVIGAGPNYYIIDKVLTGPTKKINKTAVKSKKSPTKSPPKVASKKPSPPKKSPTKKPVPKTVSKSKPASKPKLLSLQELLGESKNHLTILNELIAISGFEFDANQTYTVFAPNDDAFNELGEEKLQGLRDLDQDALTAILANHILGEAQTISQLTNGLDKDNEGIAKDNSSNNFPTLGELDVSITEEDGYPYVNDIPIITSDIRAMNGIVNIIGDVILAPEKIVLTHIPTPTKKSSTKKSAPKAKSPPKSKKAPSKVASKKSSPVKSPPKSKAASKQKSQPKVTDAEVEAFLDDLIA
jgi:uncharacterized surface protein with fasciclin (FAS1) repeats